MNTLIKSLLDTDYYKLTMQQAVFYKFPRACATFKFKSRKELKLNSDFYNLFFQQLDAMSSLSLSSSEADFLRKQNIFSEQYLNYLRSFRFDPNSVVLNTENNSIGIEIKGRWVDQILWEVPILSLVSSCYYATVDKSWNMDDQKSRICNKGIYLDSNDCIFSDFGTRRRRNYETQDLVVSVLKECSNFIGTSNVHLAQKYGVKPIGTMAHEWIMGVSGLVSLHHANKFAAEYWRDVYKDNLSAMLTDTFGTNAFFEDFNYELASKYKSVRHDSDCPFKFTDKVNDHYKSIGIHNNEKTIIYSDGLDPNLAVKCSNYAKSKNFGGSMAGIGTNFTNDFTNSPPLNIVMKMYSVSETCDSKEIPVVKLSDVPSKATGEENALRIAKNIFLSEPL